MKSSAPFATPPMSRALAAWCILVLGCCGNSPHLQAVHTHALNNEQMPLVKKFNTRFFEYGKTISNDPQHLKRESDLNGDLCDDITCTKPSWQPQTTSMSDKSTWLLREQQLEEVIKTRRSFIHLIFLDRIFGDFQSAQSVFAIQVIIMGPLSASVTRSLLFANKTIEEYEIQLPATIEKVNKGIAMLLHAPVVLDIGQCIPANNQPSSQALLREMNKHPSLRSVQGSIETQTASTILRELDNYSLWKSSTKPKHSASYYRHQPSGLTDFSSSISAEHLLLKSPVHAWTVTQDDKVRECEIISTLTLTLPESTYAQGRSRSFHWDQGTNFQHIDKGVPAEYLLLTLPGHVWKVTQDDLVRECEVRYTTALTVRLSSNQGYIFSPNQAQSILAIQVRRSKPSSVDITNGLSFAREDIEAYKIQIPTSMTPLQNIHMTSPNVKSLSTQCFW
jgi:hypothetical protein